MIIDEIEYFAGRQSHTAKHGLEYLGVIERASDGYLCLSVKAPDGKRAFNILVGEVYALTVNGRRTVLRTPWERHRIRGEEIRMVIEGIRDAWSDPYFDPTSPDRFDRQRDYQDQTDPEIEAARDRRRHRPPSRKSVAAQPAGCAGSVIFGLGLLITGIAQLIR